MTIDKDIINKSFKDYQESEPVDGGGFLVESMNKCIEEAHQLPPLVSLYPDMVLEGDLCIIFGQSGIGKTIFDMQIARYIAENGKRVLYVDCEMTPRQLGNRYETANFPPTFLRAEMDREHPAEDVLKGIEEVASFNHVDVVFIDNITALGQSLDRSADAGTLMASLNTLKKKYNWTLVVLNHVPKMFSGNVALSLSAMQGSAKINQLIDDAIGIAQSCIDSNLVYVKQCKWRNGELTMGADHVALYERGKDEYGNPFRYEHERFSHAIPFVLAGKGAQRKGSAAPPKGRVAQITSRAVRSRRSSRRNTVRNRTHGRKEPHATGDRPSR